MKDFSVKKRNGRLEPLNIDKINKCVERACEGVEDVSASELILDAHVQLFDKITTKEIDKALILSARSKIEKEPNYTYVAARILLNTIYKEVFGEGVDSDVFELQYKKSFIQNLKKLVKAGRVNPELLKFDLNRLADSLIIENDKKWKYFGIQTVYDRYLLHIEKRRMETPQGFFMRVAMGLALNQPNREEAAIKYYKVYSDLRGLSSTPTLFNSGTVKNQLSSCYLSTLEDSIDGIEGFGIHKQSRLCKFAGGLGVDWTPIRSTGAYIHGTNGDSQGLIPFLKQFNDLLLAVNQGGKRKGAGAAYLENWHGDFEDFLELRKNTGDDRRRCHDMNTAAWIPDLFMRRKNEDGDWYLFSPSDAPDIHELYGKDFDQAYLEVERKIEAGEIRGRKASAKGLWKKMLASLKETSHPWICFKDPSNVRYSNKHAGAVLSSNLCTEILEHTKPTIYDSQWGEIKEYGETAVCNLASPNVLAHIVNGKLDWDKLAETVATQIEGLDNVIDINFYPIKEAQISNLKYRPIGLGLMGFQDACFALGIKYDSDEGVKFAGKLQEFISYHAILTSSKLAKERGKYPAYEGSTWSQGIFPIDTYIELMKYRGVDVGTASDHETLDWKIVRSHVAEFGMRNGLTMAIAPTATIGDIAGASACIDPDFSILFVRETLSGSFTMINAFFVEDMKKIGLWGKELLDAVKRVDGDISTLNLPQEYKDKYKTAFQIDIFKFIEAAAERQKWIDQGQSLNLYTASNSAKYLNDMYTFAWEKGLKTTYYLRSKGASTIEKSTGSKTSAHSESTVGGENPTKYTEEEVKACSIEAMRRGEICEACQ